MITSIKLFFAKLFSKSLEKTIIDSKLGKLVCTYHKDDNYFTWNIEYKMIEVQEILMSIIVEGNLNGPFPNTIQKTYQIVDSLPKLSIDVQKQVEIKFPEKNINFKSDFYLKDIFVNINEGTSVIDFDFEYSSTDNEVMILVEFVNDKIATIEYY